MEKLLSVKETADLLSLKVSTVYKYTCAKKIPYIKLGGRVLFDTGKLKLWLDEKLVKPLK